MYLDEIKQKVADAEPPIRVVGCSEGEIEALEAQLGLTLPAAYREFLCWMGREGGPILRDLSCFYEYLPGIQIRARAKLEFVERMQRRQYTAHLRKSPEREPEEEYLPTSFPDDGFAFTMRHGHQFAYLRVSEGDDPPVYFYGGKFGPELRLGLANDHYSDYFATLVEADLQRWRENPNWNLGQRMKADTLVQDFKARGRPLGEALAIEETDDLIPLLRQRLGATEQDLNLSPSSLKRLGDRLSDVNSG